MNNEMNINTNNSSKIKEENEKVIQETIKEVLSEFTENSRKYFTADVLHALRTKITSLVHQRIGKDEIINIDVGLDLTKVEDYDFFFKVNIPKEKAEEQILKEG